MQKIKNKFIIFIILIIVSIVGFGIINSFSDKKINRDSYVLLINGNATLNSVPLKKETRKLLTVGDTVRTIGNSALAVLEWGDGSVTRLGGNSSVKIDDLYLSDNLDTINISFELLKGKSWSTVISFLGDDSYFNETFKNSVAAVRGTVFNVDLTNDYLYVTDHKVSLTTSDGKSIIVDENKPVNLTNFDFIALEKFITGFKDKTWEKLNGNIDKEFFVGLSNKINGDINDLIDIEGINIEKVLNNAGDKEELYNKILADYQKLNFIKSDNLELFEKKIELKEALIKLSSSENKNILIENTFYDFKDIVDSKNYENIDLLLPILGDNKELLDSLNFKQIINFNSLPDILKNKFLDLKIIIIDTTNEIKDINLKNKAVEVDNMIQGELNLIKDNLINN